MGFTSVKNIIEKIEDEGRWHSTDFRKTFANATTAGIWFDYSMSAGSPKNNFYFSTALEAANLLGKDGIIAGPNQPSGTKYLKLISAQGPIVPLTLYAMDYLLYYPGIDCDDNSDEGQVFDNTTAQLTRWTDGEGVQAFLVAQGSYAGLAQFYITYTNQDGVAGRISQLCTCNNAGTYGTLMSSGVGAGQFGWAIPLQRGDTGIRSVQKINWLSSNGGIAALVLVKPLGILDVREANQAAEKDFFLDMGFRAPVVADDAYINFLGLANASVLSQPIYGTVEFCWT